MKQRWEYECVGDETPGKRDSARRPRGETAEVGEE